MTDISTAEAELTGGLFNLVVSLVMLYRNNGYSAASARDMTMNKLTNLIEILQQEEERNSNP